MSILWMGAAYLTGSIITYFLFKPHVAQNAIEGTITYFIEHGFVASKEMDDGEVELITLKDYVHGIYLEESKRRAND